jgi:hypothetical protein
MAGGVASRRDRHVVQDAKKLAPTGQSGLLHVAWLYFLAGEHGSHPAPGDYFCDERQKQQRGRPQFATSILIVKVDVISPEMPR